MTVKKGVAVPVSFSVAIATMLALALGGCKSVPPDEPHPLPINPKIRTVVSQNPRTGYIAGDCAFPVYGADSTTIFVILGKNEGTIIGFDQEQFPLNLYGRRILFSQTGLSHDGGYPGLLGLYVLEMF